MSNRVSSQTLAAAIALAFAGSASAVSLTGFNEADANTVTIRIAGSSAHDKGLQKLLQLKASSGVEICQAGTLDVYTAGSSDFIYACTGGANSSANGKKLVIIKKSSGGSGTGVGTLVKAGTVNLDDATTVNSNYLDPTNATIQGLSGTTQTSTNANLSDYVLHTTGSSSGLTVASSTGADVGISDVEPTIFRKLFNPDLKASELSALTVKGISSVIFGVPVTLNVYQRLQALQFASTNVCNPNNASYGVITDSASNASSEACMPSLTRQQLQGLFTGNIPDWTYLKSAQDASKDLTNVTMPSGVGTLTQSGFPINLERRTISSGTQKAFEMYFTGENCLSGTQTFLTKATTNVVENSSGGTIGTNLTALNTAGKGGIGILSTETVPTLASAGWRFIKVDGAAPSLLNAIKGTYGLFYESTLQYRSATVNTLTALGATKKGVADAIASNLGKPAVVNDLDTAFDQVFGRAGLLGNAVDNAASAPVPPFTTGAANSGNASDVYDRPVALSTRGGSGTLNACVLPVTVNNSQASAQ